MPIVFDSLPVRLQLKKAAGGGGSVMHRVFTLIPPSDINESYWQSKVIGTTEVFYTEQSYYASALVATSSSEFMYVIVPVLPTQDTKPNARIYTSSGLEKVRISEATALFGGKFWAEQKTLRANYLTMKLLGVSV